jgi:hypothetical protein
VVTVTVGATTVTVILGNGCGASLLQPGPYGTLISMGDESVEKGRGSSGPTEKTGQDQRPHIEDQRTTHPRVAPSQDEAITARRRAVEATAGALTGVYGTDELGRLRHDWPA